MRTNVTSMRGLHEKSVESTLVTGWLSPSVKTTSARRFCTRPEEVHA
jgi:hypothetical protein